MSSSQTAAHSDQEDEGREMPHTQQSSDWLEWLHDQITGENDDGDAEDEYAGELQSILATSYGVLMVCSNGPAGNVEFEVVLEEVPEEQGEGSDDHDNEDEDEEDVAIPQRRVIRIGRGMQTPTCQCLRAFVLTVSRPDRRPFADPTRIPGLASGPVPQPRRR